LPLRAKGLAIWAACASVGLGVCAATIPAIGQTTPKSPPAATSEPSAPDIGRLGDVLLGRDQAQAARAAAAAQLVGARSTTAATVLALALGSLAPDISGPALSALAESDWADPAFIAPVLSLLGANPATNTSAAAILTRFASDPSAANIAAHLLGAATNRQYPTAARAPIVRALGGYTDKDTALGLVGVLSDADESDEIRQAAALALEEMTGLTQFGQDSRKWQDWWQGVKSLSPADFADAMARNRSGAFAAVARDSDRLNRNMDRLLKSLYFTSQPDAQPRVLDSCLTNEAPEIRRTGAQIVEIDVGGGRPMTSAARSRLLTMVTSDPSPEVRGAAAAALGLDPTAAATLLARLGQETNPDTKASLLNALALRQDPLVIQQAMGLLNDRSILVATAAADLIAAAGPVLRDPKQSALETQVQTALLAALDTATSPASLPLRRSLVAALAGLGNINLYDKLVSLASGAESDAVRVEAIGGLGLLARTNTDIAANLADFVDTPGTPPALRLRAVRELASVPTTAYIDRLVDRLHRTPEPQADIREAIWQTIRAWMPLMGNDRLIRLAERLRDEQDFTREVEVRRFYAQQLEAAKTDDALQSAASQWETIATRELENLSKPADAATDYARDIAYYLSKANGGDLPHNPFRGEAAALLAAGPPYDAAIKYAIDTLNDPQRISVVPDVLEEFPRVANSLATADPTNRDALNKAISLAKAFTDAKIKIPPSLSYVSDNLATAADAARQNLANLGAP